MNELKVITSKLQIVLVAGLGLFFVPIGLWMLVSGLTGGKMVPLGIGSMLLVLFAVLLFIIIRAYRRSVGYFSARGIGRNDGAEMPWSMLSRTVDKMATRDNGQPMLWRTEIQFNDGTSFWLIPSKISNWQEVRAYLETMPCEHAVEPA
ncbi:MAG: hypothetical protein WBO68_09390 [Pyrinomonadaceae bacterium]